MSVREEDRVSAVALVVESEPAAAAADAGDGATSDGPLELSADSGESTGAVDSGESAGPLDGADGAEPDDAPE
jgi:hypothetical protein